MSIEDTTARAFRLAQALERFVAMEASSARRSVHAGMHREAFDGSPESFAEAVERLWQRVSTEKVEQKQ